MSKLWDNYLAPSLRNLAALVAVGFVVAMAITALTISVWSFRVSFLYGVVSFVGIFFTPIIIIILLIAYR